MVHQKGLEIVDGQGKKIILRSVNLAPWLHFEGYLLGGSLLNKSSHIIQSLEILLGKSEADRMIQELRQALVTKEDIAQIAADKFNCVRVPINCRLFDGAGAPGWAMLDQLAEWCKEYNIYMIIDLHAAAGGQSMLPTADPEVPNLWKDKTKQEATVELWHRIAEHFKNNTVVAGYDILNEPLIDDSDKLIDLYKRIIKAIRSVDENHMLVVEGMKLASDFTAFSKALATSQDNIKAGADIMPFTKPLDRNMVYCFHMYTWFGDNRQKKLALYGRIAHEQKVPMWVGEFGENNYEMIDSTVKMLASEDYIAGSSFWTWKRATAKYPNINVIEIPPAWKTTMDWIANPFHKKPTKEEGVEGFKQLLKAVSIENTEHDKKLVEILGQ